MKVVKFYIDNEFIKNKLGDEYKNSNVFFTNAEVGIDNTVTITCVVTDESIDQDVPRQKLL